MKTINIFLSTAAPPPNFSQCRYTQSKPIPHFHGRKVSLKLVAPLRSSSPNSSVSVATEEEEEEIQSPSDDISLQSDSTSRFPQSGCRACGKEEIEKGCNGEGRIQGGIATVPGFGWWPIKAYRPCPGFVAVGGRYKRRGQSMDEVAFGKGADKQPSISTDEPQSRKKSAPTKVKD